MDSKKTDLGEKKQQC